MTATPSLKLSHGLLGRPLPHGLEEEARRDWQPGWALSVPRTLITWRARFRWRQCRRSRAGTSLSIPASAMATLVEAHRASPSALSPHRRREEGELRGVIISSA